MKKNKGFPRKGIVEKENRMNPWGIQILLF
jgi:hypothetical protein